MGTRRGPQRGLMTVSAFPPGLQVCGPEVRVSQALLRAVTVTVLSGCRVLRCHDEAKSAGRWKIVVHRHGGSTQQVWEGESELERQGLCTEGLVPLLND